MERQYVEVRIVADEDLNEKLVGIMSQLGFEGFWEEGNVVRCYMSKDRWSDDMTAEIESVARTVARASASPLPKLFFKTVAGRNWNDEWEKTLRPIHVTNRIVIAPSWHIYPGAPGEIVLTIDPKMSFGTGYHETTRLVLRLMERYLAPGMNLLDVGTGTGVLAIAGVKLGAGSATGVDNDEWSYRNALENVNANAVDDSVTITLGDISSVHAKTFDMIVTNIQRNVIEPILEDITLRLSPGGILIISGLLLSERDGMVHALNERQLNVIDELTENEWIALAAATAPKP
jgi:ribosomal protein L11 methyltransferase